MGSKKENSYIEVQIKEAEAFWSDKPKMTKEQLDAIDEFAQKKSEFFENIFNSKQKLETVKEMCQKALKKS